MQPASVSQVMVLKLLQSWGLEGFLAHADQVAEFYREKRDIFEKALQKHMKGLAEWVRPNASMFVWIKLRLPPSIEVENIKTVTVSSGSEHEGDSAVFVRTKAVDSGILVLPGQSTYFDGRKTCCVRVSFSLLSEEEVDEALRRLASVLRTEEGVEKGNPY